MVLMFRVWIGGTEISINLQKIIALNLYLVISFDTRLENKIIPGKKKKLKSVEERYLSIISIDDTLFLLD